MNHGALALLIARTHKAAASAWAGELSNLSLSFRSNVLEEKEMSGSTRKSARRGPPRCLGSVSEHGTKPLITSQPSLSSTTPEKIKQQISLGMHQPAEVHCVTSRCNINPPVKLAISFAAPGFSGFSG